MAVDVNAGAARLRRMTVADLRARYRELFGDTTRSGNRQYLIRKITWRLQSLAEGDLSDRARRRAMDIADDADLRMRPLMGCSSTKAECGARATPARRSLPMPGAVITREYKGRTIAVTVRPDGFEYEGGFYKSLSAVARKITGSHWNGRLFFGLTKGGRDT